MSSKKPIGIGLIALAVIALCLGLLAYWRVDESEEYLGSCAVHTYGGTNYVVQLQETMVGRTDAGCVVIVYARFENPNPFEVVLDRNWFILVDHDKDYFQPVTAGTQTPLIKLPARGVVEKEMLSFPVLEDSFAGTLGLKIGQNYWVLIKGPAPYTRKLRSGEFVSFRRRNW
jgi:hypothetical protein